MKITMSDVSESLREIEEEYSTFEEMFSKDLEDIFGGVRLGHRELVDGEKMDVNISPTELVDALDEQYDDVTVTITDSLTLRIRSE